MELVFSQLEDVEFIPGRLSKQYFQLTGEGLPRYILSLRVTLIISTHSWSIYYFNP
jgi:hypothetical protein